jgi:ferritin-like metal-binding protein YciE
MQLNSLDDLFVEQLSDLYSAERQLVHALPKVAQAASSDKLREAFEHHLDQTRGHVTRLEKVFASAGIAPAPEHCKAMEGLIAEGDEILEATGDPATKDAALIAAAQRIEHYEIAAYGTARTLADELGLGDAKSMLGETLDEESNADKTLTKIATGGMLGTGVNRGAVTSRS